jgi:hypothetical protein
MASRIVVCYKRSSYWLRARSLKKELGQYQNARFFPTASITVKAAIIGYLETGGRNGFYAKFRDTFFRFLNFVGVPKKVLLDSSVPKV